MYLAAALIQNLSARLHSLNQVYTPVQMVNSSISAAIMWKLEMSAVLNFIFYSYLIWRFTTHAPKEIKIERDYGSSPQEN